MRQVYDFMICDVQWLDSTALLFFPLSTTGGLSNFAYLQFSQ